MFFEILITWIFVTIGFFMFWRFWFLRDPVRTIPPGRNIISPADGKIIKVWKFNQKDTEWNKGFFGKVKTILSDVGPKGYLIAVSMTPIDVHFNRAPVSGTVVSVTHRDGGFSSVIRKDPEKAFSEALMNEKVETIIKNKDLGKIKVIQIAGRLARRIDSYVVKGEKLSKGQKIGLINLGSQCVVILPDKIKPKVKMGQKVYAGESVIADY